MEHLERGVMGRWDRRVLERYVEYGLRESENGGVTLVARKEDETVRPFLLSPFFSRRTR